MTVRNRCAPTGPQGCHLAAILLLVLLSPSAGLGGRAQSGAAVGQPAAAGSELSDTPQDALTQRLSRVQEAYAAAIERVLSGDTEEGREALAAAAAQLREGLAACAAATGCDVTRYADILQTLLNAQVDARLAESDLTAVPGGTGVPAEDETPIDPSPIVSAMPEIGETVSLLRGTDLRASITLNDRVKAALDDWLTWMRPRLMESYENYQFLRDRIAPIYQEAGLPEALLFAVMATETNGRVHSYSRAGAAGPLQFMRQTGQRYGLGSDGDFDLRLDPAAATQASVAYLNDQFAALNNDLEKALAAYNGGENRMRRLHRQLNGVSLWDSRVYYALPRETREYVPRVLAAAWLFLHPKDYNLTWPAYQAATTQLVLRQEIALGELTICLGQEHNANGWFRTLRNLNPRVNAGERLPAGETLEIPAILVPIYEARCLDGEVLARARELHDANHPDGSDLIPYVVRPGDTIGRIAARLRCASTAELAAMNDLRPPRYLIRVGQRLSIPNCE